MRLKFFGTFLLAIVGVVLLLGLMSREAAAGTTPPVNLSGSEFRARFPALARADDGTLCVAWSDNRDGVWNIYSACSSDGRTWSAPERVASTSLESIHPAVLFSGTVPLIFWTDSYNPTQVYTIYQKAGTSVEVVVPGIRQPVPRPSLARGSDGTLHMVFADWLGDSRLGDIYYTRRPAGNAGWLTPTRIFTHTTQQGSMEPRIAVGPGGTLHIVWHGAPGLNNEIRYMTGTLEAGGVTWSPSVTASNVVSLAWQPDIAVAPGGDVHIVWTEVEGDSRYLAYRRFSAGGVGTSPRRLQGPLQVNQNNPYHLAPAVAAAGERVCIAWNAVPEGASAEDIFLICSKDGGNTWSSPENLSRTSAMSLRPSIAVAPDGSVHVVWQELVGTSYDYDYQVYYTRWLPHSIYLPLVMRNAR